MDSGDVLLLLAVGLAVAYFATREQRSGRVSVGTEDRSARNGNGSPDEVTRPQGRYSRDIGAIGEGLGTFIGGIADIAS